jgi:hypothetical protein
MLMFKFAATQLLLSFHYKKGTYDSESGNFYKTNMTCRQPHSVLGPLTRSDV